jgi:hypothetical protein
MIPHCQPAGTDELSVFQRYARVRTEPHCSKSNLAVHFDRDLSNAFFLALFAFLIFTLVQDFLFASLNKPDLLTAHGVEWNSMARMPLNGI